MRRPDYQLTNPKATSSDLTINHDFRKSNHSLIQMVHERNKKGGNRNTGSFFLTDVASERLEADARGGRGRVHRRLRRQRGVTAAAAVAGSIRSGTPLKAGHLCCGSRSESGIKNARQKWCFRILGMRWALTLRLCFGREQRMTCGTRARLGPSFR